jgi:hypothetical protein
MHEEMHQRTSEKWQPDQEPEHMCAVLSEKKGAGEDREAGEHQSDARISRNALRRGILMLGLILHDHDPLLFR